MLPPGSRGSRGCLPPAGASPASGIHACSPPANPLPERARAAASNAYFLCLFFTCCGGVLSTTCVASSWSRSRSAHSSARRQAPWASARSTAPGVTSSARSVGSNRVPSSRLRTSEGGWVGAWGLSEER